jgi:hypothetical protein
MICNQYHLNHSDNNLWAGMFRTSLINLLYYPHLLSMSFVMSVANTYRSHVMILALWELDHLSLSSLVILIHVQSIHVLVILILSYSNDFYHQHQSLLVWLLFATFDGWFVTLPLRVSHPNLGTRLFLGGKAVTVHVYVI